MSTELVVSLISTCIALASTIFGIFSYRFNRKTYELAQTPIMLPNPSIENGALVIKNKHESAIVKDFRCTLETKRGQIFRTNDDEFLPPGWSSRVHGLENDDLPGSRFICIYKNIFDQRITITGTFFIDDNQLLEIRKVDMKVSSIA